MTTLTQRSTEWRLLRVGDVTASEFKHLREPERGGWEAKGLKWLSTARTYLDLKVAELIIGQPQDLDIGKIPAVRRGNELEYEHRSTAKELLRERFGLNLLLPEGDHAYIAHPSEVHVGFSPDYLVEDKDEIVAGGEMKCPTPANHYRYWRMGRDAYLRDHIDQIYGGMWIKNLQTYYVSSFHPKFGQNALIMWEVKRDEEYIKTLAKRVCLFRDMLLEEYQKITGGPF